jgi:hypothetical protein
MGWQMADDMPSVVIVDSQNYWLFLYGLENRIVKLDIEMVMDVELEMPVCRSGLVRLARTTVLAIIERMDTSEGLRLV